MSETFVFVMGGNEFTVSDVQVTDNDNNNLKMVVSKLVEQIKKSLGVSGKSFLDGAAMGVEDDTSTVTIKLKCLKLPESQFEFVESFSDLKAQRSNFEGQKIKSALYYDFSTDYPVKFKVFQRIGKFTKPFPHETEVYCIRLLAGNCIKFFPPTKTSGAKSERPLPKSSNEYLRWSILSSRKSTKTVAGNRNNQVYESIRKAWENVKGKKDNEVFLQNMNEIQELMDSPDERRELTWSRGNSHTIRIKVPSSETFLQGRKTTVTLRIKKLEQIFNVHVLNISQEAPVPQDFLRMVDGILGGVSYSESPTQPGGIGGYRENPKRKKRKNTKRKKRRDTRRKKRRDTRRKNTKRNKRKNTKRKSSKRE